MKVYLLAMGSNVGDRVANLGRGLSTLVAGGSLRIDAVSGLYASDPVDVQGGEFLNGAFRASSDLGPRELLDHIKNVERQAGRTGSGGDARPLDIDIIYYEGTPIDSDDLRIPHPRRLGRPFVMVPLAEICDGLTDSDLGIKVAEVVKRPFDSAILPRPYAGPDWFDGWKDRRTRAITQGGQTSAGGHVEPGRQG